MNELNSVTGALSTYGLYFIVTVLTVAIVYLFKALRSLEYKFREYIINIQEKSTEALNSSTNALKDSTEALQKIAIILGQKGN